jgi:hypothetical protein
MRKIGHAYINLGRERVKVVKADQDRENFDYEDVLFKFMGNIYFGQFNAKDGKTIIYFPEAIMESCYIRKSEIIAVVTDRYPLHSKD